MFCDSYFWTFSWKGHGLQSLWIEVDVIQLLGYIKNKIYIISPQNIVELKDQSWEEIQTIMTEMPQTVLEKP